MAIGGEPQNPGPPAVPTAPRLEATELYRFFHAGDEETIALRGVSVRLDAGEMVALLGPSGSGKSTLLACLAGLDEPDGGVVTLDGRRLNRLPEAERARRRAAGIGILLQAGNLFEHLRVADNVRLAMRLAGRADARHLPALLERIGLAGLRQAWPSQLSGGEAARAGLAVALAAQPRLLLADEPTAEVDAAAEQRILELLDEACASGMAALIATHSTTLARRAHRVVRIEDGRVVDG